MHFLIYIFISIFLVFADTSGDSIDLSPLAARVLKCKFCAGSSSPGGPCYKGPGGNISIHVGGDCYSGPGGPMHSGPGGPLDISPQGVCSRHFGGKCSNSAGNTGENCSLACRLNNGFQ